MRRAVARGTALTHHLLAFSRRRPINPESMIIAAHLKGMREMLDGSLGGHIHVEMKFGDERVAGRSRRWRDGAGDAQSLR